MVRKKEHKIYMIKRLLIYEIDARVPWENWKRNGLDKLLKKLSETGSTDWRGGHMVSNLCSWQTRKHFQQTLWYH